MADLTKSMAGRYECPDCNGKGFAWRDNDYEGEKQVVTCWTCEGHKIVFVDDMGFIIGPDAPPRYLCDHGEKLTDDCTKCNRTTQIPF